MKPSEFQSPHSCRVRHGYSRQANVEIRYFNPRTHVECDRFKQWRRCRRLDFNPRTHVECDRCRHEMHRMQNNFNPRTHVECDSYIDERLEKLKKISIHALM